MEIFYDNTWGTICDGDWDDLDASVACRQLGLPYSNARSYRRGAYGDGSGPIWMNGMECTGTESRLHECSHDGWGGHDDSCEHYDDAGILCTDGELLYGRIDPRWSFNFKRLIFIVLYIECFNLLFYSMF